MLELRLELTAGQEIVIEPELAALAAKLPGVAVTERTAALALGLQGFEERRKLGRGQFVTREEFDRYSPSDVAAVLRRMHSLRVADTRDGPLVLSTRGLIMRQGGPAMCALQIGLDGQLLRATFSIGDIAIDNVAAIEVYAGPATIPPQFNTTASGMAATPPPNMRTRSFSPRTDSYCGIVMIWTAHGR